MKILTYSDSAEVVRLANEYYDKWCDATGVKTPKKERVSLRFDPVLEHETTKVTALLVGREIEPVLSTTDAARCVTVPPADEPKWQPKWDASSISPKP